MPYAEINGLKVYYRQPGTYKDNRTTVLFIHGACQDSLTWEYQFEFMSSYSRFGSVFVDLPGHGKSGGTGFRTIEEYTDFINRFRDKLGFGKMIIAGHSMGGRIAQKYLIKHPEKVEAAILAGSGARLKITRAVIDAVQSNYPYFCKLATDNSFSPDTGKALRKKFYDRLLQASKTVCLQDFIACNEFDVKDDLAGISTPCLVIAGSQDVLAPVKYSKELYRKIRNSTLEIIENAGHFMMMENPEKFNNSVRKFLDFL